MNRLAFRCSLPVLLLALSSTAYALGLGELRGQPSLGERLRLEVEILGDSKANLDASCFRLQQPASGGDLPWLKKAQLSVRKGSPSVVEIRTDLPLREPVTQVAIQIGCGHEISREYLLLASPGKDSDPAPTTAPLIETPLGAPNASRLRAQVPRERVAKPAVVSPSTYLAPRRKESRPPVLGLPDRVTLSTGGEVGDPSLRLATDLILSAKGEATEAQRDILRLEFRMLLAMNEQATTQLATAEKLRNMEATLGELQQRAGDFSQRVEKGAVPVDSSSPKPDVQAPKQPVTAPAPTGVPMEDTSGDLTWVFYGLLIGASLGGLGWLGWRKYQERQARAWALDEDDEDAQGSTVDPRRVGEREEGRSVDLAVEPLAAGMATPVDLELDGGVAGGSRSAAMMSESPDSVLSVSATTLDEHFEANPVMELADIMLSFGRVKGAAQALQEYIDNNPQEALQPWIRLMDVYRMAGMKGEFEAVSRNLNQNFNVEVQQWDPTETAGSLDIVLDDEAPTLEPPVPVAPRPECLEDMPRLIKTVIEMWPTGDVVGYLYELLRDNRGGQRVGFALPVVEEILFLIELKETSHRMEKESIAS